MTPAALLLAALSTSAMAGPEATPVVVSAFLYQGLDEQGLDQCVRVANATSEPVDISGWSLSDSLNPGSSAAAAKRGRGMRRDLVFPEGTVLAPFQEISIGRATLPYQQLFGEKPDLEVAEQGDDPEVPNLIRLGKGGTGWPISDTAEGGVIALMGPAGRAVDVVVYDFQRKGAVAGLTAALHKHEKKWGLAQGSLWLGDPLDPWTNLASPYSLKTRVFLRDRDEDWRVLPDTDSVRDWDSGSSLKHIGEEPTHRIEFAGQSHFNPPVHTERAVITMTSAPDNNYKGLVAAWDAAEEEILVSVYYFKDLGLMEALLRAIDRGVDVQLFMEGTTVGVANGFLDQERYLAQQIEERGRERSGDESKGLGRVYWLASDTKAGIADRYQFDHSKYSIIDRRGLVIGSENHGGTGHTHDPSFGNRGFEIQIKTPDDVQEPLGVVQDLIAVWEDDVDPENHRDIVRYSDDPATLDAEGRGRYGPPPTSFEPEEHHRPGVHVPAFPEPITIEEEATFQLVLSPDNSMHENTAIFGAILGARHEILVNHLDFRLQWGSGRMKEVELSMESTPSLLVESLTLAARRGVRLRVLSDCMMGNCDLASQGWERDHTNNDNTVMYFRELARDEGLDVEAKVIDVLDEEDGDDRETLGFSKVHNKGLIIDGRTVLISSINGSENSMKGNRETAVLVTSPRVAAYYRHLFFYDWTTVEAPLGVRQVEAETARAEGQVYAALSGLEPGQTYFLAVTAFDTDRTDTDNLEPSIALGPHESAFSREIRVEADERGVVHLTWSANRSELLEGDLGGYRIWFDTKSGRSAPTPSEAREEGFYAGASRTLGPSPVDVPL